MIGKNMTKHVDAYFQFFSREIIFIFIFSTLLYIYMFIITLFSLFFSLIRGLKYIIEDGNKNYKLLDL